MKVEIHWGIKEEMLLIANPKQKTKKPIKLENGACMGMEESSPVEKA